MFELDLDDAQNQTSMLALITKYGLLPHGQSLHKMLAPERRAKFDEVAKSLGLDGARMDGFRPWFAAITLSSLSMLR